MVLLYKLQTIDIDYYKPIHILHQQES